MITLVLYFLFCSIEQKKGSFQSEICFITSLANKTPNEQIHYNYCLRRVNQDSISDGVVIARHYDTFLWAIVTLINRSFFWERLRQKQEGWGSHLLLSYVKLSLDQGRQRNKHPRFSIFHGILVQYFFSLFFFLRGLTLGTGTGTTMGVSTSSSWLTR